MCLVDFFCWQNSMYDVRGAVINIFFYSFHKNSSGWHGRSKTEMYSTIKYQNKSKSEKNLAKMFESVIWDAKFHLRVIWLHNSGSIFHEFIIGNMINSDEQNLRCTHTIELLSSFMWHFFLWFTKILMLFFFDTFRIKICCDIITRHFLLCNNLIEIFDSYKYKSAQEWACFLIGI